MRKLIICLFLAMTLSLSIGIYVLYDLPTRQSIASAQDKYLEIKSTLRQKTLQQKQKNTHADSLQNQVDSVELDARRQFRLIRPGEKIAMIDYIQDPVSNPMQEYTPIIQESSNP